MPLAYFAWQVAPDKLMSDTNHSHIRKYFHDRFVLLMLTINVFLTVVAVSSVLLRLGDTSNIYIQTYRSNLGLDGYFRGGVEQLIAFAVFAVLVLVGQFFLSLKFHSVRKQASWIMMILGSLLLVLTLLVSNALLELR